MNFRTEDRGRTPSAVAADLRNKDMKEFVGDERGFCDMWGVELEPAEVRIKVMCCQGLVGVRNLAAARTGSCSPYNRYTHLASPHISGNPSPIQTC